MNLVETVVAVEGILQRPLSDEEINLVDRMWHGKWDSWPQYVADVLREPTDPPRADDELETRRYEPGVDVAVDVTHVPVPELEELSPEETRLY
jgi:hypothetical protein